MTPPRTLIDYSPTVTYNYFETAMRLKQSLSLEKMPKEQVADLRQRIERLLELAHSGQYGDGRVLNFYQQAFSQGDKKMGLCKDLKKYEHWLRNGAEHNHVPSIIALARFFCEEGSKQYSLVLANLYAEKAFKLMPRHDKTHQLVKDITALEMKENNATKQKLQERQLMRGYYHLP